MVTFLKRTGLSWLTAKMDRTQWLIICFLHICPRIQLVIMILMNFQAYASYYNDGIIRLRWVEVHWGSSLHRSKWLAETSTQFSACFLIWVTFIQKMPFGLLNCGLGQTLSRIGMTSASLQVDPKPPNFPNIFLNYLFISGCWGTGVLLYLLPAEEGHSLLGFHGALSFSVLGQGLGFPVKVLSMSLDKEKDKNLLFESYI